MEKEIENIIRECVRASEAIRFYSGKIRLISHYDADGITSASIMTRTLSREGKSFHLSIVNQLSNALIEEISNEGVGLVIFTDLGSGMLGPIQENLSKKGIRTVILDHHEKEGEIREEYRDLIFHINPLEFGISENISGSGVTYLFARALNPENKDLSTLAIIGAIGDSQTGSIGENWGLMGLNKEILKDAETSGGIRVTKGLRLWGRNSRPLHKALEYSVDPYIPGISGSESGCVQFLQELGIELKKPGGWRTLSDLSEDETKKLSSAIIAERAMNGEENPGWIFGDVYELLGRGRLSDAGEFATLLNACGKTGNPHIGVGLCLGNKDFEGRTEPILTGYRKEIGKSLSWLEKHKDIIRETDKAVYIPAGKSISEHIISNVISIMTKSAMLPDKPVFAFADTESGEIKMSSRASDSVVEKGIDMKKITTEIVKTTGGDGGGHSGASGATIPGGKLETFISEAESILGEIKKPKQESSQNNLNTLEQETDTDKGDIDGSTESERGEAQRGSPGEGRETPGGEAGGGQDKDSKKVEGKGLVRYFLSQDVR
jgi:RecJ-like exonuclease